MAEAAAEREFPLVEIPYDLPFIAVTEQAFTRLVNEQYALLQRSIAAQERLQRIVLSERGLGRDRRRARHARRRSRAGLRRPRRAARPAQLPPRARRGRRRRASPPSCASAPGAATHAASCPTHPDLAARALALPVGSPDSPDAGVPHAWLVAAKDGGGLAEIDRLILHQAVTVVALELLRGRVADTTERRLAGDILSAAIAGDLDGAELGRRLEPFGLGGRVTTLVLAPGRARRCDACEARRRRGAARRGDQRARRPARALRVRADARATSTTSCSSSPSASPRASPTRPASAPRPARAARPRPGACARAGTRRASRSRRAR